MKNGKRILLLGAGLVLLFIICTIFVWRVDVKPVGVNGTNIGFSALNTWFHSLTGVNFFLYNITDWLGLVPIGVCFIFGVLGLVQLIKRRSLLLVDADILLLGLYYIVVIGSYLIFETVPINYRPVLINGYMEVSYPSSTTLLVLSVMPTFSQQIKRRITNATVKRLLQVTTVLFTVLMVIGRLLCGVHWLTDILGAVLFSVGLFLLYKGTVLLISGTKE